MILKLMKIQTEIKEKEIPNNTLINSPTKYRRETQRYFYLEQILLGVERI